MHARSCSYTHTRTHIDPDLSPQALDLITVAVPPALACCLAIATTISVTRLKKRGVHVQVGNPHQHMFLSCTSQPQTEHTQPCAQLWAPLNACVTPLAVPPTQLLMHLARSAHGTPRACRL